MEGKRYEKAGLTVARTLLGEPYLSTDMGHQGLLLHSVYHRPNGWDHVPAGRKVPCGESSMWGDYHLMELGVMVRRMGEGGAYPVFFDRRGGGGERRFRQRMKKPWEQAPRALRGV